MTASPVLGQVDGKLTPDQVGALLQSARAHINGIAMKRLETRIATSMANFERCLEKLPTSPVDNTETA